MTAPARHISSTNAGSLSRNGRDLLPPTLDMAAPSGPSPSRARGCARLRLEPSHRRCASSRARRPSATHTISPTRDETCCRFLFALMQWGTRWIFADQGPPLKVLDTQTRRPIARVAVTNQDGRAFDDPRLTVPSRRGRDTGDAGTVCCRALCRRRPIKPEMQQKRASLGHADDFGDRLSRSSAAVRIPVQPFASPSPSSPLDDVMRGARAA